MDLMPVSVLNLWLCIVQRFPYEQYRRLVYCVLRTIVLYLPKPFLYFSVWSTKCGA